MSTQQPLSSSIENTFSPRRIAQAVVHFIEPPPAGSARPSISEPENQHALPSVSPARRQPRSVTSPKADYHLLDTNDDSVAGFPPLHGSRPTSSAVDLSLSGLDTSRVGLGSSSDDETPDVSVPFDTASKSRPPAGKGGFFRWRSTEGKKRSLQDLPQLPPAGLILPRRSKRHIARSSSFTGLSEFEANMARERAEEIRMKKLLLATAKEVGRAGPVTL